ncbi:MAG: hypothetical protein L0Y79_12165 [Chlorobi bacterium]|nr:hypothetical protein [Chlorobiota bacterium]MCI0715667.1 hypothetical protein [Chlorobiota bacterium]
MKKLISASLASILLFVLIIFNGCEKDEIINNPVVSTKGIFILYEGVFQQPASYDYAFIDVANNTVQSNVYQNSNNGAFLNSYPDGMALYFNQDLFITAQGTYGQPGTIYKINSDDNRLDTFRNFGNNPYNFIIVNSKIYVTNIGGDYVSIMDLNFNSLIDSLAVGPNPSDLISALGNIYIAKASYTYENSVAVINISSNNVTKIFFSKPPISVANNTGGIYVSTYTSKKLYILDSITSQISDSISIQIPEPAIGTIVAGNPTTLYVLGVQDTSFSSNIGKKVYRYDLSTNNLDPNFSIEFSGTDDVYGIEYDPFESKIYIANSRGGTVNGEVRVYDKNGNLLNTYSDIGGKLPKRFAFKR